jgi:hypothetical protein
MSAASAGGVITLSRTASGWRDRLRRYQIIIDGERVATIKRGVRLDLTAGRHTVHLQISWARSPQLGLEVSPGEVVALECAPGHARPFGPGAENYIELRRAAG